MCTCIVVTLSPCATKLDQKFGDSASSVLTCLVLMCDVLLHTILILWCSLMLVFIVDYLELLFSSQMRHCHKMLLLVAHSACAVCRALLPLLFQKLLKIYLSNFVKTFLRVSTVTMNNTKICFTHFRASGSSMAQQSGNN